MDARVLTFTSQEYFDFFPIGNSQECWQKFSGGFFSGPHVLIALYSVMGVTNDERDDLAVVMIRTATALGCSLTSIS